MTLLMTRGEATEGGSPHPTTAPGPEFRVANVPGFEELLGAARDDAAMMLGQDPQSSSPRGEALRTLLYLFECDEAVRLFRAA